MPFAPGQRWTSESEPELGLGCVLRVTKRTVLVVFGASAEQREYALDNAPLRRVRFRVGDTVRGQDDRPLQVESIGEQDGLLLYRGAGRELRESELNDTLSFNKPEERLLAGQADPPEAFDLRAAALRHQHRRRQSGVRGFTGGRIELIPHQLSIAAEVTGRLAPRVLLADEVGLGKTIEASLILHRLLLTGRVQRVLILVPESLIHQWFVELLRRFNLWFNIFDAGRCEAIVAAQPEANPFLDDQLILSSLSLFTANPRWLEQAQAADWDMLVVDEAHHLGWSPSESSLEYQAVEALGRQSPGLLLLTATPEQLGLSSHFARLRLLDPDRFFSFEEFRSEMERYREVAALAAKLLSPETLGEPDIASLAAIVGQSAANVRGQLARLNAQGESSARAELVDALLDRHGTGRVMFRNTRATVSGFPKRLARLNPLPAPGQAGEAERLFEQLANEFAADTDPRAALTFQPDFSKDPRLDWLATLLRALDGEKLLLICRSQRKVEAVEAALSQRLNLQMAVFHEGLPLVKRDRNAAWFAEEDGARLLLCSEIGSEGRNFQFAHHLVLLDLPLDPELLEQRIGRLDRIGQTADIHIHVPFVIGSPHEVLARWYHEGLNALSRNLPGGRELLQQFGGRVRDLAQDFHETEASSRPDLRRLLEESQAAGKEVATRLEQGRDRLLELNSFQPKRAAALVEEIRRQDAALALDDFMVQIFDHYSIHLEELTPRTWRLGSAGVFADVFPGLPTGGLTVTCERARALAREDVQFLTWDHPLVTGALDLLLGSERGNCCFALWNDPKQAALYLEALYLLECVAPAPLHVDRFLPPTPVRVVVDHRGNDAGDALRPEILSGQLKRGDVYALLEQPEWREELLPSLLGKAHDLAQRQVPSSVVRARQTMNQQLNHEVTRLRELQKVNRSVRAEEIALLLEQQNALEHHLAGARLRLDAIRIIQRGSGK
jgi:ATP-dependent helicase HepA